MKKVNVCVVLIFLLTTISVVKANYGEVPQKVVCRNEVFTISDSIVKEGKIYVPVREVLEKLDYNVFWNETDGSINIEDQKCSGHQEQYTPAQIEKFNNNLKETLTSGVLSDNKEYPYTPKYTYNPQKENLSYKEYLENVGFNSIEIFDNSFDFSVDSPEDAAQMARIYLKEPAYRDYKVVFDSQNMAWIVIAYADASSSPPSGVIINAHNGQLMCIFGVDLTKLSRSQNVE